MTASEASARHEEKRSARLYVAAQRPRRSFASKGKAGGDVAVYRCSVSVVSRSKGRSATAAAAYRAGERIDDRRTGLVFDYGRRSGVLHSEILAAEDSPEWVCTRAELWNRVEEIEKRKDSQVAREVLLALPNELSDEQRLELTRAYVREQFVDKGMVADVSIHAPGREGDERNHHAHVLLTMRPVEGDKFGAKAREWNEKEQVEIWRKEWADHQNRAFEKLGLEVRVDHRSLEAQGIDREPEPKLGPTVSAMERRGIDTDRGDERRQVQARNDERDKLQREYADLCRKLGVTPEQLRTADPLRVASRSDPMQARAIAREKRAERLRHQAAEKVQDKRLEKEWRAARAEATAKEVTRQKTRDTGNGTAGAGGAVKPPEKRKEKTKEQRRAAMIERQRRQKEERHRDFGRER
jgi:ATP-dependent exoDNAse (exonuclease V) alpha subunit